MGGRYAIAAAALAAGLFGATSAAAQSGSSVIIGTVVDAVGQQPVADVMVTATSPNLQGEQVVVTDRQGNYRIPQLPPGEYILRFEVEPFRPYSRPGIQLRLNRTIRVNVALVPLNYQEVVDDAGAPAVTRPEAELDSAAPAEPEADPAQPQGEEPQDQGPPDDEPDPQ